MCTSRVWGFDNEIDENLLNIENVCVTIMCNNKKKYCYTRKISVPSPEMHSATYLFYVTIKKNYCYISM